MFHLPIGMGNHKHHSDPGLWFHDTVLTPYWFLAVTNWQLMQRERSPGIATCIKQSHCLKLNDQKDNCRYF